MSLVICPHCQTENPEEREHCLQCGRLLGELSPAEGLPDDNTLTDKELAAYFAAGQDQRDEDDLSASLSAGLPDWLSELEAAADESAGTADPLEGLLDELGDGLELDLPDWLQAETSRRSEAPEPEPGLDEDEPGLVVDDQPEAAPAMPTEGTQVPDWLADILDEEEAAEIFALEDDEDLPGTGTDWLKALESARVAEAARQADEVRASVDEEAEAAPAGAGDDRLEEPTPVEEAAQFDFSDETLPELHASEDEPAPADQAEEQPMTRRLHPSSELRGVPEQIAGSDLPDWLAEQLGFGQELEEPEEFEEEPPLPDWLEPIEAETADQVAAQLDPASLAQGTPDEAVEAATEMGAESAPDEAAATGGDEDWLTALADLHLADEEPSAAEESLEATMVLEESVAPDWMEALKPPELGPAAPERETAAPERETAASTGPLSGLQGVIAIEPIIAEPRGSGRGARSELAEEQRRQVALLEQLMLAEERPAPAAVERLPAGVGEWARLLIGLVLLAAVVVGWLWPDLGGLMPELRQPPVTEAAVAVNEAIQAAQGQIVLVAFDYAPGAAGEMDRVADTLLNQLAAGGSPVLTLSQSAPGVALARQAAGRMEGLQSQSLGYLPGETVGLRRLSGCLDRPADCDQLFPALADRAAVESLPDVGLIVVLTSERDQLVGWLEQVAAGQETPLVAGVTQGLSPVAAAYAGSNRLAGFINGVPGAAAYERAMLPETGRASQQLDSLTLAQWLAAALLAVGGLYYAIAGLFGGRKRAAK